ncbi:MAG: SDR family oxidoreductase [Chromatiales bacterium]|nr:SDR family oxidoreductase [Chromatiales bacterium]
MQTILITGSTRGIGKGLAREFLRLGHQVIVTGRSAAAVSAATAELAQPARVLGVVCDVRQPASVQAAWDAGVARFGRIDVWISNAAVATDRTLLADLPADQIQATVDTNLLGTLYGCQVAIRGMRGQPAGGKVFTFEGFGSDGIARPGLSVYGSTKRALRYLTASLAKECAGTNVLVGSLSPGIVATDLLLYSSKGQDPVEWERARRTLNILGDTVETVTPWLAREALAMTKQGARIAWLTPAKAAGRFATSFFRKRDILSELEARPNLTVR